MIRLSAATRALNILADVFLGFRSQGLASPQALCCRPLRGLCFAALHPTPESPAEHPGWTSLCPHPLRGLKRRSVREEIWRLEVSLKRRNIRIMSSRLRGLISVGKGRSTHAVAAPNLRTKKETRKRRARILRRLRCIARCHFTLRFCWQISKLEVGILRSPTVPIKHLQLTAPPGICGQSAPVEIGRSKLERLPSEKDISLREAGRH
jgi:hypothetical protein